MFFKKLWKKIKFWEKLYVHEIVAEFDKKIAQLKALADHHAELSQGYKALSQQAANASVASSAESVKALAVAGKISNLITP